MRKQTLVQLSDDLIASLDAEAQRLGSSRSAVIREAVERYFADGIEASIDRAIVEGYTRLPPGTPDGWGDLEAQADRAAAEVGARLDAEEAEDGAEPW